MIHKKIDQENQAKYELICIADQSIDADGWISSPLKSRQVQTKREHKSRSTKIKTEVNSPRNEKKHNLKAHLMELMQLKKTSVLTGKQSLKQDIKLELPLKAKNTNINTVRIVEQKNTNKKKPDNKLKPFVLIENFQKEYENEQEKIRMIIKKKVKAKELLKKKQTIEPTLNRQFSFKQVLKRSASSRLSHFLPHIII